jgi:NB-ARC domain
MDITEVLQFVDSLIYENNREHLDDLQQAIIKGLWEGKTYEQIATDNKYKNINHIGTTFRKLCKELSEKLPENVSYNNFFAPIQRAMYSSNSNNNNVNFCHPPTSHPNPPAEKKDQPEKNQIYHDLSLAKITNFCDRSSELENLSTWLSNPNTRLISVLGLSGIGKTTLVRRWVDLNLDKFNIIVWKSVKIEPSLNNIITEILTNINTDVQLSEKSQISQFFQLLNQQKCLIILDDVQELFMMQQFTGQYQTKSKNYQNLFTKIQEIETKSRLILISQEPCQEMLSFDEELSPVKCLELQGLNNIDILKNK